MKEPDEEVSDRTDRGAPSITISPKVRTILQQASLSLEAAVATLDEDPNASLDDLLAAQLLIHTLLASPPSAGADTSDQGSGSPRRRGGSVPATEEDQ